MRKAIDTAPRNGDPVILEDAARGTIAVARWSAETAQWVDEHGAPSQLTATHWHAPKSPDGEGTPSQLNANYWHSLTSTQSVAKAASEPGSPTRRIDRGASRPASGGGAAQPQRVAKSGRSVSAGVSAASSWFVRRRRSIATMAACLLVGAAFVPFLQHSDFVEGFVHRAGSEDDTGLKQALRQEQERADKLASDVAAARREAESQAVLIRQASEAADREKEASEHKLAGLRQTLLLELAKTDKLTKELAEAQRDSAAQATVIRKTSDDAARAEAERVRVIGELREALQAKQANGRAVEQVALKQEQDKAEKLRVELAAARREGESRKEASARATDELRQALQQAQEKAEKLAGELAVARREVESQAAVARTANEEARQAADRSKRSAEEQSQALREAQGKAEKLATELAAARQEVQSQEAAARAAKDEAAGVKENAERSAGEQRRARQQERERADRLATELAETKSSLETQAKATAAEEAGRDNQLATLRQELQKAKAEATAAREALEAERSRTQRVEQQAMSIQEGTGDRGIGSSAAAAPPVIRPSTAASSVPEASGEQGSPHAIRLVARANVLLDQGNIGAARNMLDRAAEMGNAAALFWLAETYDPLVLSARQTFGTQSDVAKARELYRKALTGGVSEAKFRLEALQKIGGDQ